jgi:hypothetical protein
MEKSIAKRKEKPTKKPGGEHPPQSQRSHNRHLVNNSNQSWQLIIPPNITGMSHTRGEVGTPKSIKTLHILVNRRHSSTSLQEYLVQRVN